MSGPRIKVDKRPGFWRWECLDRTPGIHAWANRSDADIRWSQSEALQSGLAHLRDHHPEIVWAAGGDMYAPTVGTYCRAHGTRRDACGCGGGTSDPEPLIVAPGRAGEARTGDYGPLDQAHNEGSRR